MLGDTGAVVTMQERRPRLSPCVWPWQLPQHSILQAQERCMPVHGERQMWWQTCLVLRH